MQLICDACGKKFKIEKNGPRKYCDECKKLSQTKRDDIKKRRELREAGEEQALLERRRKRDPFNPALMSDRRLGAVIKLFGMTYGTYTAAYRSGILLEILKGKGFKNPRKMIKELEVE